MSKAANRNITKAGHIINLSILIWCIRDAKEETDKNDEELAQHLLFATHDILQEDLSGT
jgi:hypothetical protein